jgi:hypothetical protein
MKTRLAVDDLVDRLNAEANRTHTPLLLREDAAVIYTLRRHNDKLQTELNEVRNVRRSDDQVGLVCATCGLPVETEPCPMHSPLGWEEAQSLREDRDGFEVASEMWEQQARESS